MGDRPTHPGVSRPRLSAPGRPRRCPPGPSSAWTPQWSGRWGAWASPPGPAATPALFALSASGALPRTPTGPLTGWAACPAAAGTHLHSGKTGRAVRPASRGPFSGRRTLRHLQSGRTFPGGGRAGTWPCPPRSCCRRPGPHRRPPRGSCAKNRSMVSAHGASRTILAIGSGARALILFHFGNALHPCRALQRTTCSNGQTPATNDFSLLSEMQFLSIIKPS